MGRYTPRKVLHVDSVWGGICGWVVKIKGRY